MVDILESGMDALHIVIDVMKMTIKEIKEYGWILLKDISDEEKLKEISLEMLRSSFIKLTSDPFTNYIHTIDEAIKIDKTKEEEEKLSSQLKYVTTNMNTLSGNHNSNKKIKNDIFQILKNGSNSSQKIIDISLILIKFNEEYDLDSPIWNI